VQLWQKIIVIPKSIVIHEKGLFQTKCNQESFTSVFEVGYFECFDESFIITLRWTTWIGRQTSRCERT
jgi:hypothetical protein